MDRLYLHAWLIKHENTVWSEDRLKWLYDVYDSRLSADTIFNAERWLLDDNTKLQIICKASYKDFRMYIVISEEKYLLRPQKPLWVDLNR
jgi:hypothetical protein